MLYSFSFCFWCKIKSFTGRRLHDPKAPNSHILPFQPFFTKNTITRHWRHIFPELLLGGLSAGVSGQNSSPRPICQFFKAKRAPAICRRRIPKPSAQLDRRIHLTLLKIYVIILKKTIFSVAVTDNIQQQIKIKQFHLNHTVLEEIYCAQMKYLKSSILN